MEEHKITNRHGLKIHIQVDTPIDPCKLVFIAHGQKGSLEQTHIQAFADAYLENGFRVVRFDATHALGKSDGDVTDVTYDNYINDLEDVINWSKNQQWYQVPFSLCGHSMGAQSVAWYAEHHPEVVKTLASMAPVVNYELYTTTFPEGELSKWKKLGYQESMSKSKGIMVKIGWQVIESLKKYDLLLLANHLTMPLLIVVGDHDQPCPKAHQEILVQAINSPKATLEIIPGAEHSYRNAINEEYGSEVHLMKHTLSKWLHQNA